MKYQNNTASKTDGAKNKEIKIWWRTAMTLSLIGILLGIGFIFAEAKYQSYPACESSFYTTDNDEKIPLMNATLECVEKEELNNMKTGIFENTYILGSILIGASIIAFMLLLHTIKHNI